MTNTTWDPGQYLRFADERTRPFVELLSRVGHSEASHIVDLGCGPGNGEGALRALWPKAHILGVDASDEMIQAARRSSTDPNVEYVHKDVRAWMADPGLPRPDIVVSNAMFQWVEGHLEFLPHVADTVAERGVFALQVPANFGAPSHRLLREIAGRNPYAQHVTEKLRDTVISAEQYLDVLARPGWEVDAWETTYLHILHGDDPVFEWIRSTGARPVLNALPEPLKSQFIGEYKEALRAAYPPRPYGTVLHFDRVFVVARRN